MKILLFGRNGQLGWELQRSLTPLGELMALGRKDAAGDFIRPAEVIQVVRQTAPDVIVNAAAYTAVDQAERESDLARQVNALTPALLAEEARKLGAWFVHYSTDYVFDGSGDTPWRETDPVGPLNVYGATKAEGEAAIKQSGCRHLVFRTSWVYAARGQNFARTMLRLARERNNLSVVNDQVGAPTGAELLADVTAHALHTALQHPEQAGLYHLAAAGETSWHGYAQYVLQAAHERGVALKVLPQSVRPIPSSAYPTSAKRPANSRLDTHKLRTAFGLTLPDWRVGVARMMDEILDAR
jgi:dTDP-4-dehydrorhamnose reductase